MLAGHLIATYEKMLLMILAIHQGLLVNLQTDIGMEQAQLNIVSPVVMDLIQVGPRAMIRSQHHRRSA